jgi:single stranded DNA-binding protein
MAGIKVSFVGNLGSDAEERFTQDGKRRIVVNVAVNTRQPAKDGGNGEWEDHTDWFRCTGMGRQVDYAAMLNKGNRVLVYGTLKIGQYTTRDNEVRTSLDVWVDDVQNLTPRDEALNMQESADRPADRPAARQPQPGKEPAAAGGRRGQYPQDTSDLEDLPF